MKENSFYAKALARLGGAANWPNAEVQVHALVTETIPELCKVPYDYLYRDSARAMVECTLLMQEYFDFDLIYANTDVYNFEGEAMGAEIKYFPDHCPNFQNDRHFIKDRSDLGKIKYTGLDMGRFPYILEYCKAYKEYTEVDTFPELSSPWTLAGNLYGIDNLLMDCYDDPEFVTTLLDKIVDDFLVPMYNDFAKTVPGFHMILMGDAYASIPVVTLDIVQKFIRPALERLKSQVDVPNLVMIDTAFFGISKLPESQQQAYIDFIIWANGMFLAMDEDLDDLGLERIRDIAAENKVMLTAGMKGSILENSPIDEVVERIKEIILVCKDSPSPLAFLFSTVNPGVPNEKVRMASHAARIYAAVGADENTPYVAPEPLTFEDFLKGKLENNVEGYGFEWMKNSGYSYLL